MLSFSNVHKQGIIPVKVSLNHAKNQIIVSFYKMKHHKKVLISR